MSTIILNILVLTVSVLNINMNISYNNTSTIEVNGFGKTVNFETSAPNLWWVHNAFSTETLTWMQGIYIDMQNKFEVTRPEKRLLLTDGVDHQRIQSIGAGLTPKLEKVLNKKLNFMTAKFWLDLPNFGCQPHGDSAEIIVTLQIYVDVKHIEEHQLRLYGAEFMHVDPPIEAPLKANCGYLNLNTDQKVHKVNGGYGVRQSIAFQYTLSTDN